MTTSPPSSLVGWQDIAEQVSALREALRPFVDMKAQNGAWGAIDKKLDGLAPMTVTVTKAQMLAAFTALQASDPSS